MTRRGVNFHPGPMRMVGGNPEFAGLIVGVGIVVMGVVGLPIARWFLLGALGLGAAVALLLRLTRKIT
jgi:hypothetical protein